MKDKPWFPFYWKDWSGNIELKLVSLEGKGMLIDLMSMMWQSGGMLPELKGMVNHEVKLVVVRMLGVDKDKGILAIDELLKYKRLHFNEEGILCCRKLMEIHDNQRVMSERGKKGGNPKLKHKVNPKLKQGLKPKDKDKDKYINSKKNPFKKWSNEEFVNEIAKANEKSNLSKDECNKFYLYWTEPDANGVPKYKLNKTWSTAGRMSTWKSNNFSSVKKDNQINAGGKGGIVC